MNLLGELSSVYESRSSQYRAAEVALAATPSKGKLQLIRGCIRFLRDPPSPESREVTFDYGRLLVERRLFSSDETHEWLQRLTTDPAQLRGSPITIGPLSQITRTMWEYHTPAELPNPVGEPRFYPWPSHTFFLNKPEAGAMPDPPGPIATARLPIVSDTSTFIDQFIEVPMWKWPGMGRGLLVFLPDYRARIDKVLVKETCVMTHFEPGTAQQSDLTFRVLIDGAQVMPDQLALDESGLSVTASTPEVRTGFQFYLLDSRTDELVDWVNLQVSSSYSGPEVVYDRPGGPVAQLIKRGENETIEFKQEVGDGRRIVQSVLAFANSGGGTVLVGVNDHGMVGVNESGESLRLDRAAARETIERALRRLADPIVHVEYDEADVDGASILVVRVARGDRPPYLYRDSGSVYVRRGRTNFHATSQEIHDLTSRDGQYR